MKRRLGKFYIPIDTWSKDTELALYIIHYMSLIPLRVECLHFKGEYEVIGSSVLFRELFDGEKLNGLG